MYIGEAERFISLVSEFVYVVAVRLFTLDRGKVYG